MAQSRFMDIVKNVGEAVLTVAPGLRNAPSEILEQLNRSGQLGSSEMANLINHGSAFVLYGPNQFPGNNAIESPSMEPPSHEPPSIEPPEHHLGRSM
jgi:hypothetical protein